MSTPAGWYPDPTSRHQNRWFDGNDWTDQVADGQAVEHRPGAWRWGHGRDGGRRHPGRPRPPRPSPARPRAPLGPPRPPGRHRPRPRAPLGPPRPPVPLRARARRPRAPRSGPTRVRAPRPRGVSGKTVADHRRRRRGARHRRRPGRGPRRGRRRRQHGQLLGPRRRGGPERCPRGHGGRDPSASDLFDDMADEGDQSDGDVFGTDDEPADEPADHVPPATGRAYPQEVIDNFNGSCTSAGSPAAFCGCVIDELQAPCPTTGSSRSTRSWPRTPTTSPPSSPTPPRPASEPPAAV